MIREVTPDAPLTVDDLLSVVLQQQIVKPKPGHRLEVTIKAVPERDGERSAA